MNKLLFTTSILLFLLSCNTQNKLSKKEIEVWNTSYGGANKSYDKKLLSLREEIAPKFQTLSFKDKLTGRTMIYNLFIPKNYDNKRAYPLVLFMADASTTGKGAMAPLKQGYGGIIWATDESQKENPSFVLVPAFEGPQNVTNDQWEVTEEADIVIRLLQNITKNYNIDEDRIYTTGQSMGGMISFHFNLKYSNIFAASLFVGSQWDTNILSPLGQKSFFYIISAADPKASIGMKELKELFKNQNISYGEVEFSALLPQKEQEDKIKTLLKNNNKINFVQFTPKSVIPQTEEALSWKGAEHMYSFDYAYLLKSVRQWLFQQRKN